MLRFAAFTIFSFALLMMALAQTAPWDGRLVEWGTMREAIGRGQSQGRGSLEQVTSQPHFYGLGALAELKGEATVIDSRVVATEVSCCGHLLAANSDGLQATFLLGAYVQDWDPSRLESGLDQPSFEERLGGLRAAPAFPFLLEGELLEARVHVINGACPMHARSKQLEIPEQKRPFERTFPRLQGKVLGFFAEDSVGVRTHPGTRVHAHVVFSDPESGQEVTAHLESFTVGPGATLKLPR